NGRRTERSGQWPDSKLCGTGNGEHLAQSVFIGVPRRVHRRGAEPAGTSCRPENVRLVRPVASIDPRQFRDGVERACHTIRSDHRSGPVDGTGGGAGDLTVTPIQMAFVAATI